MLPRVSVVTPTTLSRSRFIDLMISNIASQTYPKSLMEWVVVGDTDNETRQVFFDAFQQIPDVKCVYFPCAIAEDIGGKRNFASSVATSTILACMDDDDIYIPEYLEYSVQEMRRRKVKMVGCKDMLVFFPESEGKMTYVHGSHIHEATIVCTKKHWKTTKYSSPSKQGEGVQMMKGSYDNCLDIRKIMVCLAHGQNSCDKSHLLGSAEVDMSEDSRKKLLDVFRACNSR